MYYSDSEIEQMMLEDMIEWQGEGYYSIEYTDGGKNWMNGGPVYMITPEELANELRAAYAYATPSHLPYPEMIAEYLVRQDSGVVD